MPRMTRRRKLIIGIAGALALFIIASSIANKRRAGIAPVQVSKVTTQNLTQVVTASGEIRPGHYVNINAQNFGKIAAIEVAEGDTVKTGQVLLRMDAAQPVAGVDAQKAMVNSATAAVAAAQASQRTAAAELTRSRADFERAELDWERAQQLSQQGLISKSEYDTRKSSFESARAGVVVAEERVRQSDAELDRSRSQLMEMRAGLSRSEDELQKTIYTSPIDGIVTSLPVHVGEQMVPGVMNSPGSYLLTVSDMVDVSAEVRVDESDVLEVKVGQPAEITIDAYPDSIFRGKVAEVGTTALLRSTGQSSTQLTAGSQEAKDFKVVIVLDNPPAVRPGLSSTARITTATRDKVVNIPLQALTIRRQSDIDAAEKRGGKGGKKKDKETLEAATSSDPKTGGAPNTSDAQSAARDAAGKKEVQGVFVVKDGRARFRPVKTGITSVTDIEILSGLQEGEEIVTGSYKVLRELKHLDKVRKAKKEPEKTPK